MNFFKKIVDKEFEKILWGKIRFNFDNLFEKKYIGKLGDLESNIIINDHSVFRDLVLRGDLGFAESYISKKWDTSNLNHLLKILLKNQQLKKNNWKPNFYNKIIESVNFILKKNTINQAKKNISFHYDLGNNFYKEWLDSSMTYSSALFKNKQITLLEAQIQKYDSIIENLNINSSSDICEIGCGWGGFIDRSKQRKNGVSVDGYTISKKQYGYTKLNHNNVFFEDYRKINKKYSNVVSIEMFEAVGKKYWNIYFEKLNNLLKKNGTACLQIITINEGSFRRYLNNVDFIQKYIFPGGMLPTKSILQKLFKNNGFKLYHKISFGYDYSRTLLEWKQNFNNAWPKLKSNDFDEKFKRLWNYYLDYCETGFSLDHTDVTQFFIKKIN
ncbi:MAG: cyclopropane-fatty-acyl-phospholipid synthase [Pelagibacteraceae bacterium TMED136]|nr:MAG: cyclopropane-fatty-acyl-phospholipid synthase [Pelagibacteraceae bacterium TMED136]|tara:strand:+ start:4173 stop:5327 length:1155 start_codon:yes stop_codon:yes gene_type:complete